MATRGRSIFVAEVRGGKAPTRRRRGQEDRRPDLADRWVFYGVASNRLEGKEGVIASLYKIPLTIVHNSNPARTHALRHSLLLIHLPLESF